MPIEPSWRIDYGPIGGSGEEVAEEQLDAYGMVEWLKQNGFLVPDSRLQAIADAPVLICAPISQPHDFADGAVMAFGASFTLIGEALLTSLPAGRYAVVNLDVLTEEE